VKEQPKISALLNNPSGDFAFFKRGNTIYLFEGLRPLDMSNSISQNETNWIHVPQFFHLRYEFLTFDQFRVFESDEKNKGASFNQEPATESPVPQKKIMDVDLGSWQPPHFQNYEIQFNHIKELILRSQIRKAVPVVFERSSQSPERRHVFQMIQNLLFAENVFCYGLVRGQEGILGGTPEFLFSLSETGLESLAVAGTQWEDVSSHPGEWSSRLKEEHQWVIEDLENKLRVLGNLTQEATEEIQVGFLRHLKTRIKCQLHSPLRGIKDFYFLIKKLHPTAALGLSSQQMNWKEMEFWPGQEVSRGSFGAPLTFRWSPREALSLVTIRQISWNRSGARIGAGGGIVRGSELSQEWIELKKKIKYVKFVLGIK
jgi:isochorismate synthase EntC